MVSRVKIMISVHAEREGDNRAGCGSDEARDRDNRGVLELHMPVPELLEGEGFILGHGGDDAHDH